MIPFDEALDRVKQQQWNPAPLNVPLGSALGRRLSGPFCAVMDSPAFTNSAMDGYAVGSIAGPWHVEEVVAAGCIAQSIGRKQAARIFTGAMVPGGTVAVVAQEDCDVDDGVLKCRIEIAKGSHLRTRGEEFRAGTPLFEAGTKVTPPVMSALAAQGVDCVAVGSMPRIGILSTGNELLHSHEAYRTGQVYESNSVAVSSILRMIGCTVFVATSPDDLAATKSLANSMLSDVDMVVSIGGVSVGDYDFVRPCLDSLGFTTQFAGVGMKPGKPVTFATREDGKAWFALPGNPMSAIATCCLFVLAYLGEPLDFQLLTMADDFSQSPGREAFVPGVNLGGNVRVNPTIGSHATYGLAFATGLVRLPGDETSFKRGSRVMYADLPWRPS